MNRCERDKLNDWIGEHIMGLNLHHVTPPDYSSESRHAMDVLKKCAEKLNGFELQIDGPTPWAVRSGDPDIKCQHAETLELAICLFAKALFSQSGIADEVDTFTEEDVKSVEHAMKKKEEK